MAAIVEDKDEKEELKPGEVDITLEPEEEKPKEKVDPRVAQENITPESPRFKEVYGKMKTLERKIEEYEAQGKSTTTLIEDLRKHNERLAKAIESSVDLTREAISAGKDSGDDEVKALHEQQTQLREKKTAALKQFDYDAVAELDDQLMEVKLALKELSSKKSAPKQKVENEIDPAFGEFVDSTPWFNGDTADPIMISAAYEIDKVLLRDPKWTNQPIRERLAEVGRRVEARFGWTSNGKKKPPSSGVEGRSSVTPTKTGETTVRLTADELTVCKGLGITPEAYARQKAYIQKGGK